MSDENAAFKEMFEWCTRVHCEVGVTPKLREAMEFYRRHYPDDAKPEQGDGR
jgi:oligoribonuclease (3'-5' exoribonuclease)